MLKQKIGLITLLAGMAAGSLYASNTLTNYTSGDVLVCFRNGGNDLVVNAGPVSTFIGYAQGSSHAISAYSGTQLDQIGLNGSSWQVFTWQTDDTLYITRPRVVNLNSQTIPWKDQTASLQHQIATLMTNVVSGAVYSFLPPNKYNANSTDTAVIEKDNSSAYGYGQSYHDAYNGNFTVGLWGNLFQGNPENALSGTFADDGVVARSDFYKLTPSSGSVNAIYLGYFELSTNGSLSYVAYPATTPTVKSITRSGNSTTITYKTGVYGTYTLLGSSDLTAAVNTWAAVGTLPAGDTVTHTTNFTDNASLQFYSIKGQ